MSEKQKRKIPEVKFSHFLEKFPEIKLPVILAEEAHHSFSKKNDPLPAIMVEQFILPIEQEQSDEFTEFVPCLRIPATHDFHAVIYWRASLMDYRYTLATFSKKGELIDKRVIGGTYSDGKTLTTSVATFDEDWMIYIASGQSQQGQFEATESTAHQLELLPEGFIINPEED